MAPPKPSSSARITLPPVYMDFTLDNPLHRQREAARQARSARAPVAQPPAMPAPPDKGVKRSFAATQEPFHPYMSGALNTPTAPDMGVERSFVAPYMSGGLTAPTARMGTMSSAGVAPPASSYQPLASYSNIDPALLKEEPLDSHVAPPSSDRELPPAKARRTRDTSTDVRLPRSFADMTLPDQMLWLWHSEGRPWGEIRNEWEKMTGHRPGHSTLPNRFARLKAALTPTPWSDADDRELFDAKAAIEATFESQKWEMIAEEMRIRLGGGSRFTTKNVFARYEYLTRGQTNVLRSNPALNATVGARYVDLDDDEHGTAVKLEDLERARDLAAAPPEGSSPAAGDGGEYAPGNSGNSDYQTADDGEHRERERAWRDEWV